MEGGRDVVKDDDANGEAGTTGADETSAMTATMRTQRR